jgi:uncharacterized protein (DUF433 family)
MDTPVTDRIVLDPAILAGKPEFIIGLLADGWSEADLTANYPSLSHEDVLACLAYARDRLGDERVFPSAS